MVKEEGHGGLIGDQVNVKGLALAEVIHIGLSRDKTAIPLSYIPNCSQCGS